MSKVRVLVLRAPGTNCDMETVFAFEQAGATANRVHINQLVRGYERLSDYQILVVPGGFTYGDDISAGRVLANEFRMGLGEDVPRFVEDGGLILGICNGFQVLVKAGILSVNGGSMPLTLTDNDSGRFECRWVNMVVNRTSPCVFTKGIDHMALPVAHAEGKVVTGNTVPDANIVLRYADEQGNCGAGYPHNPNGSMADIAGICDDTGRVFALMPHPERFVRGTQHPQWTRRSIGEQGDGLRIFQNAVRWAESL
ncbi:MAG: phosphoribosylformylglycinamidine synthase I [Dehalococcoidales bacterium]|nr:MAG: phosphoribosylformylglycinamidine synthase I [Dehalococcoidales bacterium]